MGVLGGAQCPSPNFGATAIGVEGVGGTARDRPGAVMIGVGGGGPGEILGAPGGDRERERECD